jgi:ElaB/YqjD/DUF883 family membrane-anchored ribosome-binding protein
MEETRFSLSEKLETLEQQITESVQGAKSAVDETVENVKEAVRDTVSSVKDTFDLELHVERRPWTMLGASVALGYLGGFLLRGNFSDRPRISQGNVPFRQESLPSTGRMNGHLRERLDGEPLAASAPASEESGWLSEIASTFAPEITKLKGLAVGTLLGVARDMLADSAPEGLRPKLSEVVDDITVKLGGEPIRRPLMKS